MLVKYNAPPPPAKDYLKEIFDQHYLELNSTAEQITILYAAAESKFTADKDWAATKACA